MRLKLDLPPGIVGDDTPFSTGGRWIDGNNVRFVNGKPEVIGHWRAIDISGVGASVISGLHVCDRSDTRLHMFAGGWDNSLYHTRGLISLISYNDGNNVWDDWDDIAPAGTGFGGQDWKFEEYGDVMIIHGSTAGGTGKIAQQSQSAQATIVTNAPEETTDIVVADQRQLIALGCEEEVSGSFNPLCIRGSDIEDITDWTTSTTNNAFEVILEGDGRIVAGHKIGPYLAVWTTDALWLGSYIGAGEQVWRFDKIAEACGLGARSAATVMGGRAYWLGLDMQFRVWAPGELPKVIPCSLGNMVRESFGMYPGRINNAPVFDVRCVSISSQDEIWWFYPDTRDSNDAYGDGVSVLPARATRYVAYSAGESMRVGTHIWFKGELERTAACDAGALARPVMALSDTVYYHELQEFGDFDSDHVLSWSLKADGLHDSASADAFNYLLLEEFWPDFEYWPSSGYYGSGAITDNADMTVTVKARAYPQSSESQIASFTVAPADEKKDFIGSQGRIFSTEFSGQSVAISGGNNAERAWVRFGVPSFEVSATGSQ